MGKLLSPARRRACIEKVKAEYDVSERRACRVLGQHRSTQRKKPRTRNDEAALTADIIELARLTAAMATGGSPPHLAPRRLGGERPERVQRIWRREGLKVPQK